MIETSKRDKTVNKSQCCKHQRFKNHRAHRFKYLTKGPKALPNECNSEDKTPKNLSNNQKNSSQHSHTACTLEPSSPIHNL